MANTTVNKVIYDGNTLIDLTADDVTVSSVLSGIKFHGADGGVYTGTCTYDADTQDATATASEILSGKTAYKSGTKVTGTMPNRGAQTSTISSKTQTVTINQGYHDGGGTVSISSTEQAKIIAGNILSGVTILGVTGTVQPSSSIKVESTKSVTPKSTAQTVTPSSGYNAIAQVNVAAIPYVETDNSAGGKTVTIG